MSMIPVETEQLAVGEPLAWTIYDQDRNVLMELGQRIESEDQLQSLLARMPLRELDLTAAIDNKQSDKSATENANMEASLADASASVFTFHDMRLRVGDRIQLQPPAAISSERFIVKVLGYLDNASLMVTAPFSNGMRIQVREHDKIVARVFSSQKAFGFDCSVVRVCTMPYNYLHLSFPDVIQGSVIRKSPRIKTKIIASIAQSDAANSSEKLSGVIIDLSADGAMVKARQPLAEKSQTIVLSFRVSLHNMEAYVTTKAIVRNIVVDEDKWSTETLKYQHGIQFLDLQPNDSVILQSLIYQQMIEQPHTLA